MLTTLPTLYNLGKTCTRLSPKLDGKYIFQFLGVSKKLLSHLLGFWTTFIYCNSLVSEVQLAKIQKSNGNQNKWRCNYRLNYCAPRSCCIPYLSIFFYKHTNLAIFPHIYSFPLYLHQLMLVNVKLPIKGYMRTRFTFNVLTFNSQLAMLVFLYCGDIVKNSYWLLWSFPLILNFRVLVIFM